MGVSFRGLWLVALLAAAMLMLNPIPARATVTCASVGVAVNITLAAGDAVTVARSETGNISVLGTGLAEPIVAAPPC